MTREEREDAINCFKNKLENEVFGAKYNKLALEALEQEPQIRPKGHWIEERNEYGEIEHWHCSNCYDDSGFTTTCKWDYCPNCGSDNREVEK